MGSGIPAGIYVAGLTFVAAIVAAIALSRARVDALLKRRALLFFMLVGCSAPLLQAHVAILIVGTLCLWLLLPARAVLTVPFCMASLFVVPDFFAYEVPFPGINYLLTYRLWMAAAWIAFIPLILRNPLRFNAADILFTAYVFWGVALDFRGVSVTEGLRQGLIQVSWLVVPYLAASRSLRGPQGQSLFFQAIVVIAVILCCATIFTQLVGWHYLNFTERFFLVSNERRFGLIRTGGTLASGLFGLICIYALMVVYRSRDVFVGSLERTLAALLLVFGLLSSGARGAMLAGLVAVSVWLGARLLSVRILWAAALSLVIGLPVLIEALTSTELTFLGDQANINYRQRLLAAAMRQFRDAPWLGDRDFIRSPYFTDLVQGQGIIDIVNAYVQILLAHGLVGLGLFAFAAFVIARGMIRQLSMQRGIPASTGYYGLLLGFLAGYLVLIATTSQTSYVAFFGALLLGLGRAAGDSASPRQSLGAKQETG